MNGAFEASFERTLGLEGGDSKHPDDLGRETRYGITIMVARANGYDGPMSMLPLSEARRIARTQYWDILRLDQVAEADQAVAHELFDTGYNMGVEVAGRFLQRSLNAFNRRGVDYPDLRVDGVIGPITVARLRDFLRVRRPKGGQVLLRTINCLQGARYVELVEAREKNETFAYGWMLRRVGV